MRFLQTSWRAWELNSYIPGHFHIDESKAKPPSRQHVHLPACQPLHPWISLRHSLSQESRGQHLWKHRPRVPAEALQKLWRQESRGKSQDHFCHWSRPGGENTSSDGPEEENQRQTFPISKTAEIFHQSSLRTSGWIRTLSKNWHLKTKWVCEILIHAVCCCLLANFSLLSGFQTPEAGKEQNKLVTEIPTTFMPVQL